MRNRKKYTIRTCYTDLTQLNNCTSLLGVHTLPSALQALLQYLSNINSSLKNLEVFLLCPNSPFQPTIFLESPPIILGDQIPTLKQLNSLQIDIHSSHSCDLFAFHAHLPSLNHLLLWTHPGSVHHPAMVLCLDTLPPWMNHYLRVLDLKNVCIQPSLLLDFFPKLSHLALHYDPALALKEGYINSLCEALGQAKDEGHPVKKVQIWLCLPVDEVLSIQPCGISERFGMNFIVKVDRGFLFPQTIIM
ncbi:hypothetical protein ONZ45_g12538 [Pleurotus djamor]|nr:hypothetical protein ONZ45_g12538 [Pleurotus djamor]